MAQRLLQAQIWAMRQSLAFWVALMVLGMASLLGLLVTPGLLAQTEDMARRIATQTASARANAHPLRHAGQAPSKDSRPDGGFYGLLIDEQAFDRPVQQLFKLAQQNQLTLFDTTYRYLPNADGQFLEMAVEAPIKGSYAQIVRFCEGVLSSMPYAALDAIDIKREHITASEVEAHVRFIVYLKPAVPGSVKVPS